MKKIITNILYPSFLKRKIVFILFDVIAFSLSLYWSFQIRDQFNGFDGLEGHILIYMLIFVAIKLLVFYSLKLYNISWRLVSLQDVANISKACLLSSGILFILIYGSQLKMFSGFPRSILAIDLVLTFLFSSGLKISKRMYVEVMRQSIGVSELKRTLIIGAGSSGEQLLRDINRSPKRNFHPVGFVDDDQVKQNMYLQGIRVLGKISQLKEIISKYNIESILISVLSADRQFHRRILNIARESGITDVKVVNSVNDTSNSLQVGVKDIRDIDLSDLIGRQAVSINTKEIIGFLNGRRVLITGAAGSIGSEIASQVLSYHPEQIGILDINESDLANLELQLARSFPSTKIQMFLCDISNEQKVERILSEFKPDTIFHAAAYKHVPVMEKFPEEAVRVNILGTKILSDLSIAYGVKNFILISTDKAVNPTSIMGASKRIAEHIVTGAGKHGSTNFVAVRFGNVIGSRGSALPIFIEQLKNGGPITITHPEMKRFFMTIPEAVALVLQAAVSGRSGDVFVLDMGEPIKIVDLAKDLILLNNLIPGKDIKIEFTGIREGEKLYEEVLTAEEGVIATNHKKIFKARLVYMHNKSSIDFMIEDFKQLIGNATKKEWLLLFKNYVPTLNAEAVYENSEDDSMGFNTIKSSLK